MLVAIQTRFPRSKKKRIQKKWETDLRNVTLVEVDLDFIKAQMMGFTGTDAVEQMKNYQHEQTQKAKELEAAIKDIPIQFHEFVNATIAKQ
jgi:hypothetical protein